MLFLADHKAPIATVQVFYHVGSKDEHVGIRGVAHMFEHMMFKGSEHVPPEEHARLLKEVGGQVNAFTTEDLTAYHDTVPPSYVGFALQLEAERMRQLKLFPATVDSERRVVEEEKRLRIDNDPIGKAIEKFRALAYVKHPYNWTPIGTIEDLEKVTPADCQRFYDAYYQPNNATLIVIGDVDEAAVRKLVEQHFGAIPRGPGAAARPPRGAAADGDARGDAARSRCRSRSSSAATTSRAPPIPTSPRWRCWRRSCRAASRRACTSAWCGSEHLAIAAGGVDRDAGAPGAVPRLRRVPARSRCRRRCGRCWPRRSRACATSRSRADELDKAKNQLAAGFVFGLQTVDGIAQALGQRTVRRGRLEALRRGRDPLPGGHRRRRPAGREEVPGRHQPHPRHAGPARRRTGGASK